MKIKLVAREGKKGQTSSSNAPNNVSVTNSNINKEFQTMENEISKKIFKIYRPDVQDEIKAIQVSTGA